MSLKDRLKAALTALRQSVPVETPALRPNALQVETEPVHGGGIRATTIPLNSPEGQRILAAMASGDPDAMGKTLSGMGILRGAPEDARQAQAFAGDARAQQALKAFGGDGEGNFVEWDKWAVDREALEANLPGWTACRFYNLVGPNRGAGVFGAIKGPFGIWSQPYAVCGDDEDETMLPALTHLNSGLALACFESFETAHKGAEVLATLDWAGMPQASPAHEDREAWRERSVLVKETLAFHGIIHEPYRHAHDFKDPSGMVIPIYTMSEKGAAAGKPSKRELS